MELPPSTSTVGGTLSTNGVLRAAAAALAAAAVCYKQQQASKANDGAPSSLQIAVPPPSSDTGLHTSPSENYLLQNRSRNPFQPASATQALPITFDENNPAFAITAATRRLLPTRLIFVRHGQSEANADHSLLRTKPDNLIELTDKGLAQAQELGKRIKAIVGDETVGMVVSPFLRTMQTARNVRLALDEEQMVKNVLEPRLREQEFGNLQGDEFIRYREEQGGVGRFWYRFPTGESGCDVYARVSQWMEVALPRLNMGGQRHIENLVVVSHGLTMRLALMHLAGWSPNTFHTVWNANNCQMYNITTTPSPISVLPD
jgi:broad specificity phosphatase PhoE